MGASQEKHLRVVTKAPEKAQAEENPLLEIFVQLLIAAELAKTEAALGFGIIE